MCHVQGFFLVVGDQDAGDVQLVVRVAQPAAQFFAHLGVECAKGFVQQEHFGLHRQDTGQGNALVLAARELQGVAVCQPVELHQLEQAHHLGFDVCVAGAFAAGFHVQAKRHVEQRRDQRSTKGQALRGQHAWRGDRLPELGPGGRVGHSAVTAGFGVDHHHLDARLDQVIPGFKVLSPFRAANRCCR